MCFSRGDRHDSMRFDLKSGLTNQREMLKGNMAATHVTPASRFAAKCLPIECCIHFEINDNHKDLGYRS
jgi:hypothetical protein